MTLERVKILRLHDKGLTCKEIAADLGKSQANVFMVLKRAGEHARSRRQLILQGCCENCGIGMYAYRRRNKNDTAPLVCNHCRGLPENVVKA